MLSKSTYREMYNAKMIVAIGLGVYHLCLMENIVVSFLSVCWNPVLHSYRSGWEDKTLSRWIPCTSSSSIWSLPLNTAVPVTC